MPRLARMLQPALESQTDVAPIASNEDAWDGFLSQEQQLDEIECEAERAEKIFISLEAIAVSLEQYRDEGLSLQSASFLQHALEANGVTVDDNGNRLLPALEAFDGSRARLATSISLENVQDQLKKAWETLLAVVQRVWESVKAFIASIVTQNGRIKARAKRLGNHAAHLFGTPAHKTVEVPPSVLHRVSIDGRLPSDPAAAIRRIGEFVDASSMLTQADSEALIADIWTVRSVVQNPDSVSAVKSAMKPLVVSPIFAHRSKHGDVATYETPKLPGEVTFVVEQTIPTSENGLFANVIFKEKRDEQNGDEISLQMSTMGPHAVQDVAKAVMELCDVATKLADEGAVLLKQAKEHIHSMKLPTLPGNATDYWVRKAVRALHQRLALIGHVTIRSSRYAVMTGNAYLSLAELSLKEYPALPA